MTEHSKSKLQKRERKRFSVQFQYPLRSLHYIYNVDSVQMINKIFFNNTVSKSCEKFRQLSASDFIFRRCKFAWEENRTLRDRRSGRLDEREEGGTAYRNYSDQSSGLIPLMGLQRH